MKKSLILAGLLLASTSVMATEAKNSWYGGLEIGTTKLDYSLSALGATVSDSESAGTQTLKIGKYLGKYGRVSINYSNYNTEANVDANTYGISYDYMFYNTSKFTPFLGLSAGKMKYEISGLQSAVTGTAATLNKNNLDLSGSYYSFGIGALYEISDNFDFEIGGRLVNMNGDDTVVITAGTNSASVNAKVEDATQLYVGINYNF